MLRCIFDLGDFIPRPTMACLTTATALRMPSKFDQIESAQGMLSERDLLSAFPWRSEPQSHVEAQGTGRTTLTARASHIMEAQGTPPVAMSADSGA